jgi:flagellar hook-basal body complex protein FliE
MPDAIGPLSRPPGLGPLGPVGPRPGAREAGQAAGRPGGPTFGQSLGDLVSQVNRMQHEAANAINALVEGNGENLHEVMLAVNKAELSFNFLMEARNKLVDAYHEVIKMSV